MDDEGGAEVIELAHYRAVEGTRWAEFVGRCVRCGWEAVYVAPFPDWATAPVTGQCARCERLHVVLAVADPPDELNGPEAVPWAAWDGEA